MKNKDQDDRDKKLYSALNTWVDKEPDDKWGRIAGLGILLAGRGIITNAPQIAKKIGWPTPAVRKTLLSLRENRLIEMHPSPSPRHRAIFVKSEPPGGTL